MQWSYSAASLSGPYHKARGAGCQDAWEAVTDRATGTLVVAVADGAGSLPRSAEGAALAVARAVPEAMGALVAGAPPDEAVNGAWEAAASALQASPDASSIGCTLSLVAAGDFGWACALVGDSFVVLDLPEGLALVRPGPAGEYANITKLLTSDDPDAVIATGRVVPSAVFAASDGLARTTLGPQGPHAGFYLPLLAHLRAGDGTAADVLAHMDALGLLDDDATIAVGWQPPDGP